MSADPAILRIKHADVVALLAKKARISYSEALRVLSASNTYKLMSEGRAAMHCRSDICRVNEIFAQPRS